MLKERLNALSLPADQKEDYQIEVDKESGTATYINKNNPGDIKTVKYGDPKVKKPGEPKFNPNLIDKDEEGKLFYYAMVYDPESGTTKKVNVGYLSDFESQNYQTALDKKQKTGSSRNRSRSSSKKTTFDAGKIPPSKLGSMTPDDIADMSTDELTSLWENKNLLSPNTRGAIAEKLKKEDLTADDTPDGPMGPEEPDLALGLQDAMDETDDYDEKTAMRNVDNFFDSVVKDWGRADLTPNQWRDEIDQEKNTFTDAEWNLILALFKKYTGESY